MKKLALLLALLIGQAAHASSYPIPKPTPNGNVLTVSGGKWVSASPTGGVGINHLSTASSNLEANVGDWLAYADAAGTEPVDGTGGSPTITCTRSTTNPLRDDAHLLITKDAANRQGQGCAATFTIDRADRGRTLAIKFDYEVMSGTYDAGSDSTNPDLLAFVYGPTDGTPTVQQVRPMKILGGATGTDLSFSGKFDTASSGVAYRLILHEAKTGTSAYTVAVDNIVVGPETRIQGPPVTDWVSFTPTSTWVSNATHTGKWRRVGDTLHVEVSIDLSGAPTSADLRVNLPSGFTIDTAKLSSGGAPAANQQRPLGLAIMSDTNSGNGAVIGGVTYANSTSVDVFYGNDGAPGVQLGFVNQAAPFTFDSSDFVDLNFSVPILGWASNVLMSTDASVRPVVVRASKGSAQSLSNSTQTEITFPTETRDTHGAFDTSNGRFTAPFLDDYTICAMIDFNANTTGTRQVTLYKGGVDTMVLGFAGSDETSSAQSTVRGGCATLQLAANEYVSIYGTQSSGGALDVGAAGATFNWITVTNRAGAQQLAAVDNVYMYAGLTTAQSGVTDKVIPYNVEKDSHGGMSSGTYTVKEAGLYMTTCSALLSGSGSPNDDRLIIRYDASSSGQKQKYCSALTSGSGTVCETTDTKLLSANQTIDCYIDGDASFTIDNDGTRSRMSVTRIGF